MCGIVGKLRRAGTASASEDQLRQMLAMIRHRGPDQFGIYLDPHIGLGSARLSIVDLSNGQQPISNEDETLWIVFNGEIFNFRELQTELRQKGHRFKTESDTEVILHLFEEHGPECLSRLNGQFVLAIWDTKRKELFLGRDRLGVRPLFYTQADGGLIFGSEIKALLSTGEVVAEIDPVALDQVFTYWSTLSPRTIFTNVFELPPGHYLLATQESVRIQKYWELDFTAEGTSRKSEEEYLEEFSALLLDSIRLRLQADVPVGAYLSGGLDSSVITAIARQNVRKDLATFSIAFDDVQFDESAFQCCMAKYLGTQHEVVHATQEQIGEIFPQVIWHTETPLTRTAPAPMFLLSQLVNQKNYKVVLTGEGADELLAGYDLFKEAKIRRFWSTQPQSKWRPLLFKKIYPDIAARGKIGAAFDGAFFGKALGDTTRRDYSHAIRWQNNQRARRFFSDEMATAIAGKEETSSAELGYPQNYDRWGSLEQGQYLEAKIFLSQYLLSSQGDRMSMANSVEGRFPFLDFRLIQFCSRLPAQMKMRGLTEKYLLKRLGKKFLPETIWNRAKKPYRAPIHGSFFHKKPCDYVSDLLSDSEIAATGFFKPKAVSQLVNKVRNGHPIGETDDMALVGILSTQLVHQQFIRNFRNVPTLSSTEDVKICGNEIKKANT